MNNLKIVFMGTPEFSVPILENLIKNFEVIGVVTQPDKEVGRKKILTYSPIKTLALKNNIKVFQPIKIRKEYQNIIDLNPDMIVTCAYGQIIPKELLEAPKYGCINVHASLLPKLRGGAPIHHAIIDGYKTTGITIMYMDEGMDSGDIITQKEIAISENMTTGVLHDKLSLLGADLIVETIPNIVSRKIERRKQNIDEVTFAYTIKREDELIDFNDLSLNVYNKVRGLNPWPLAYMKIMGTEIKIIEGYYILAKGDEPSKIVDIQKDSIGISTKDGIYYITKIKPFGKKIMDVKDYLNGVGKKLLEGCAVNEE